MSENIKLYLGDIWHIAGAEQIELQRFERGALAVGADGRIAGLGEAAPMHGLFPEAEAVDYTGRIILPGFIDAHLHFPQLDIIGSWGEDLIGWLNRFTFPTETRFFDFAHATRIAERLVTELLANGTTTAVMFASTHRTSAEALFAEAERRGLWAVIGKVSMDRNAPESVLQDPASDARDTLEMIAKWHGRAGRLFYALTPRFAPTCSEALMQALAEVKQQHPEVYVQTHWAEQAREVAWVRELFPGDADYLGVYERLGLLGPWTILAHGIQVQSREWEVLRESGSVVAHCPTSNFFLGSGLMPWARMRVEGIPVALGSDIGGGTSLSMWRTMDAAYKVARLRGETVHPAQLLAGATIEGARALGLDAHLGNLEPGKAANFQVLDPMRSRLLAARFAGEDGGGGRGGAVVGGSGAVASEAHAGQEASDDEQLLFALITLADDRLTEAVYIDGKRVYDPNESKFGESMPMI